MTAERYEIRETNSTDVLKAIMAEKKMNCTDLGGLLGCSRQSAGGILRKDGTSMRVKTLVRIAGLLGYEVVLMKKGEM